VLWASCLQGRTEAGATTFLELEPGRGDGEHMARRPNQILRRF
jgi:hypothetical protein